MELTLKQRKAVANGALPKFALGWEQPSQDDILAQAGSFQHSSKTEGVTSAAGAFEADQRAKNAAATDLGGMPSSFTKAPKGGAGAFLKNNAGGIMNIATSAMDFIGTMSDISTNKISSDEMMGSGGTSNESANGISYQQSKVDEAGISNQIDATAKAGTMAAMGKGAALGGAIGSVIPGLGTVAGGAIGGVIGGIAGLFGSSKAKREAERQKRIAINRTTASNTQNREMAYTTGLRNEFNRENVTDTSQSLFHAETGAENLKINPITGETIKKFKVNTAFGPVWDTANSQTHTGEMIISKLGPSSIVKNGPHDNALTHLRDGDTVVTARKDIISPKTGRPIIFDAYEMAMNNGGVFSEEEKNELDMNQRIGKMMMYAGKRKPHTNTGYLGGTLKKYSIGDEDYDLSAEKEAYYTSPEYKTGPGAIQNVTPITAPNISPATTTNTGTPGSKTPGFLSKLWGGIKNAGSGLDLSNIALLGNSYLTAAQRDARAEGLRAPKSFVANPYEQDALQQLNSLHSDYYPVWAQQREAEARAKSAIMQSGGLGAQQKMLGLAGIANQTQQNMQQALFEHQGRENALRAQAAKASLEAGNQTATRQQQAYQWDEDMLAKAHAARENMWETSAYDRQNGLTQFFKNAWEKNQFDRTMNLYESQQKDDHAKTQAIINNLGTKNTPATLNGVAGNAAMLQVDPTTGKFVRTNPFSASQLLSEDAKKSIDNQNNIVSAASNAINGANTGAAPKIARPKVAKAPVKKTISGKKPIVKPTNKPSVAADDKTNASATSQKPVTQTKPVSSTKRSTTVLNNETLPHSPAVNQQNKILSEIAKKPRAQRTEEEQNLLLEDAKNRLSKSDPVAALRKMHENKQEILKKRQSQYEKEKQQKALKAKQAAKRKTTRQIDSQAADRFAKSIGNIPLFF